MRQLPARGVAVRRPNAASDKLEGAVRRSTKLTAAMYRYATPETLTQVLAGGAS